MQEELINTDAAHACSMEPDTRLDWFKMALMQVASGNLKASALYDTVLDSRFATTKALRDTVTANLHLFSSKQQQKAVKEAMSKLANVEESEQDARKVADSGDSKTSGKKSSKDQGKSKRPRENS